VNGRTVEFPAVADPARPDAPTPRTATGYLAVPESGSGPGIVVSHAWWGLNDTFRGVCDRLAANGFVALAPDLYGDRSVVSTIEEADARVSALDEARAEQAVLGAADRLRADAATAGHRLGVIGFSLGAPYAFRLANKRSDVGAVVMVYSPGGGDPLASRAPVQLHWSPQDAYEDAAYIESWGRGLVEAGRPYEAYDYPGRAHWFFEPDRPEYDAAAAELVWERLLAFFQREMGPRA
jgi:carboxymethylenebutenolidase